jgi:hypothetical protein
MFVLGRQIVMPESGLRRNQLKNKLLSTQRRHNVDPVTVKVGGRDGYRSLKEKMDSKVISFFARRATAQSNSKLKLVPYLFSLIKIETSIFENAVTPGPNPVPPLGQSTPTVWTLYEARGEEDVVVTLLKPSILMLKRNGRKFKL